MLKSDVNLEVFRRYSGLSLPRHVSYPMPTVWHELSVDQAASMLEDSDRRSPGNDLSLYIHVPFCEALCKYCACNRVIQGKNATGATERTEAYVAALVSEIRRLGTFVAGPRTLRQIHWGGGSPTYLTEEQIGRVQRAATDALSIASDAEVSIEIDPRTVSGGMLQALRGLGFNRVSLGVQDFDEQVQRHVRRIQSLQLVSETVDACREVGFDSINFDLIYGMPYQTPESIRKTVEETIKLSPDRVAYYHYAQIPEKIATQRGMDYTRLPDSETKLEMFLIGLELFPRAGYEFVGLDHFAKSDEGLCAASREGTLQRNFQGMTTGGGLDMLGAGSSSISQLLGIGYMQNLKELDRYIDCVQSGESPIERGKRFTTDDLIRQTVIQQLYCDTVIRPDTIEAEFGVDFKDYFARELAIMKELEGDGLVTLDEDGTIRATCPLGRVLLRNVASAFDAYLRPEAYRIGEETCYSANA